MINVPQTATNEVIAAINSLIAESEKFRDWNSTEIQTINDAIAKLQKVDARSAFIARGQIAAICGNVEDVSIFFNKALLHPDQPATKHEYWTALVNVGLYSKASELGCWLLDPKRGFFPTVWQRAVSFGQTLEVWDRLPDATKTYPELSQEDFSHIEVVARVMRTNGLRDQDVLSVLDLMGEVQRAHGVMFAGKLVAHLRVMTPPDDAAYLYIAMQVEANVVEVRAMNRELARLVVDRSPTGVFPQGLVATFAKSELRVLRAAA